MWADRTMSAVQSRQQSAAAVIEHHPSKVGAHAAQSSVASGSAQNVGISPTINSCLRCAAYAVRQRCTRRRRWCAGLWT